MILYGAPVKEKIKKELIERVKRLERKPHLAIIQVGGREDSNIYISQKQKFGEEIGVKVCLYKFAENIKEEDLILEIQTLNIDENIDGIILQLPLPTNLNARKIVNIISAEKDVDGLNVSSLRNDGLLVPATARGVATLLDYYDITFKGKKVTVIGQSLLAGRPIADELEKRGAKVSRCDINTKNIPTIARECDILISAVGKAGLITKEFIRPNQVVIDVGINRLGGKLVGDVDFAQVEPLVAAVTPVPGGIGPLTVACLFQNLLDLDHNRMI